MTGEPLAEAFRPSLRKHGLVPSEQGSITPLLVSIAHNQLILSRQLAELDAWMNANRLISRTGTRDTIQ
jgi:hypothetical protein